MRRVALGDGAVVGSRLQLAGIARKFSALIELDDA
jgi:hypothetical protein